jgi:retron-type reverse transcriptase
MGWVCLGIAMGLPALVLGLVLVHCYYRLACNGRPFAWLRARFGWGLRVEELARRLDVPADELRRFEPRYTPVTIRKRSGGQRRLLVPDAQTKALQRRLLGRVFRRLRAHPAACGFERGRSIVHNAAPHVGQAVVVRMDVVDFFPATSAARLDAYFRRIGWNREAAALLTRFTTQEGGLPQGAPTSPRLSNLVNYFLDVQLTNLVRRRKGTYTRYADDITLSFPKDYPRKVRGMVQRFRRLLKARGYRMHRRRKLNIRRRHQRQEVTGLVVNERVQLPRRTRRWLRAVEHRHRTTGRATLSENQLAGWRALQKMIERQGAPPRVEP